jgi:hypothetical protein
MRALVVYESMYGNTHLIAGQIGEGLRSLFDVEVVPVFRVTPDQVGTADLIVVGGPTHAHGMSRRSTRQAAAEAANKPGSGLELDADAMGPGLREWFDEVGDHKSATAAAFDTRVDMPRMLTGSAGRGIERRLRRNGYQVVTTSQSFFVDKHNRLLGGEEQRAATWGKALAASAVLRLQVEAGTSGTGS